MYGLLFWVPLATFAIGLVIGRYRGNLLAERRQLQLDTAERELLRLSLKLSKLNLGDDAKSSSDDDLEGVEKTGGAPPTFQERAIK